MITKSKTQYTLSIFSPLGLRIALNLKKFFVVCKVIETEHNTYYIINKKTY